MRKQVFGRKLRRDKNERKALFRSLMNSLIIYGKIKTSEAKAKSIKGEIEKLVTAARKGEDSRRLIVGKLANEVTSDKLINEIAPLFATRPGGYTRILKLGVKGKDNSPYVMISFVEAVTPTPVKSEKREKGAKKAVKTSKESKVEVKSQKKAVPAKKAPKKK